MFSNHDGIRDPYILATENDVLNGLCMLLEKQLTGRAPMFSDVRTYWSGESVKRVTGYELEGHAKEADGFMHLINSGASALDFSGVCTDEDGNPIVEKKVTIFLSKWVSTKPGDGLALFSELKGFEDCEAVAYQWMVNKGDGFEEVKGATGGTYFFTATEENLKWGWKLAVYFK